MSARATAIAVVALLVLGVALIAQAWRMKDYSLNVSIARERQDDDPEDVVIRDDVTNEEGWPRHRGRDRTAFQSPRFPARRPAPT